MPAKISGKGNRLDLFKQRVCAKISRSCNGKSFRKKTRRRRKIETNEKRMNPRGG